jgi:hemerythrin
MKSDKKIRYYASKAVRKSVVKKLSKLLNIKESIFYNLFDFRDLEFDVFSKIDNFEVKIINTLHPVETNLFLVKYKDKSFGYFCDICSNSVIENFKNSSVISDDFADKIRRDYHIKCDIKKVDIGGGLIHGEMEDFKSDDSKLLLLSHTSKKVDESFGFKPTFGQKFTLIDKSKDYETIRAKEILQNYIGVELGNFEGFRLVEFDGDALIAKAGERVGNLIMVIKGEVKRDDGRVFGFGSTLEEITATNNLPLSHEYRALDYALLLYADSARFRKLLEDNDLEEFYGFILSKRVSLESNRLFEDGITSHKLNTLAKKLQPFSFKKSEVLTDSLKENQVYLMDE